VGKTAIVEWLAQRIANGDVPEVLRGKRLVQVNINSMVAGATSAVNSSWGGCRLKVHQTPLP
jgi:ATP-dependent Clp protease ATP-binding subunit ClpA